MAGELPGIRIPLVSVASLASRRWVVTRCRQLEERLATAVAHHDEQVRHRPMAMRGIYANELDRQAAAAKSSGITGIGAKAYCAQLRSTLEAETALFHADETVVTHYDVVE